MCEVCVTLQYNFKILSIESFIINNCQFKIDGKDFNCYMPKFLENIYVKKLLSEYLFSKLCIRLSDDPSGETHCCTNGIKAKRLQLTVTFMIYVKIGSGLEIITHTYCFLSTYEDSFNETLDIRHQIHNFYM